MGQKGFGDPMANRRDRLEREMFTECEHTEIILDPSKLGADLILRTDEGTDEAPLMNGKVVIKMQGGQVPSRDFISILEDMAGPSGAEAVFETLQRHTSARMLAEVITCKTQRKW